MVMFANATTVLTIQKEYKMFNSDHIGYMVISGVITIALLILLRIICKTDKSKRAAIKFFAILTVAVHYSSLWVDFLTNGSAIVDPTMLFPLFACNVCMWLLLISACIKKRDNFAYRTLTEFTFWAGCVCGFVGILLNEQFAQNPDLQNYHVLKGLLSHSTMIVGAALLAVLGIVKIRVRNVLSVALGLALFIIDGAAMNAMCAYFGFPPCNSMFLLYPPFADLPWLNCGFIGGVAIATAFVLSALYEQIFVKKGERWYNRIGGKKKAD